MNAVRALTISCIIVMAIAGCPARKQGVITGTVSPPSPGVRVTLSQAGQVIAAVDVDRQYGTFQLTAPAGLYDVSVTALSMPMPIVFPGIEVKSGDTTTLPLITIPPSTGAASITGRVSVPGASVKLLLAGSERASTAANKSGSYEFQGLPEGQYTVGVSAPGYANDSRDLRVGGDQSVVQNIRLLYASALEGADWTRGTIKVRGVGLPPHQAPTPTVKREMAKRAALADAQRNLLRVVELVQVGPNTALPAVLGQKTYVQTLQGYLQGFQIVAERDLSGGRMEVEIELPLTGPNGLSSHLPL